MGEGGRGWARVGEGGRGASYLCCQEGSVGYGRQLEPRGRERAIWRYGLVACRPAAVGRRRRSRHRQAAAHEPTSSLLRIAPFAARVLEPQERLGGRHVPRRLKRRR